MGLETAFEVGQASLQIKRIADTLVASQKDVFVRLPALLAYYPMGIRQGGSVTEHGGVGYDLFQTGTCEAGYDGNSFAHLGNGTNFFWNNQTAFGITGLETWVTSSLRGLTVGGWFMVDTSPASLAGLVGKYGVVTNYGYAMRWDSADVPGFFVSGNGSSVSFVAAPASSTGGWHFIVGRFIPSTEVAIIIDGDKASLTTAIPASIYASTQDFEVGRYANDNARILHGKTRDVFICAAALSDALIEEIRTTSTP